jgi:hypothetical protein
MGNGYFGEWQTLEPLRGSMQTAMFSPSAIHAARSARDAQSQLAGERARPLAFEDPGQVF